MPCIKLSSGKTVCYGEDTNKYPDGGPVNKNKPIVDKGVDINAKPWMKDNDSWIENILEIVDPTGISSWDDVRRARNNYGPDSNEAMIEMSGAIPFLGKIGKSGKIITGGFGLLQDIVKGSKYLPSGAQKKVLDKTYDLYQKYAKSGGKELDEILGSGSKLIRDNVPLLNPSLHASSSPVINSFNFLQKFGRGKTTYDAATGSKDDSGFKGGFGSNEPLQYDGRNVLPDLSSEYSYSQGGTIFFNHEPVRFPDGGEVDLKLNRVPKPVKDDFDMSGGFHGNLFHNVGARGELNYGPLNMSGQAMLSGYDKSWNPNVSSNLSTNVQVNPKLNVSGNLNYNYNKGEGSQFSPTIGANYQANPNLNISGSFSPGSNSASFSIRKKFPDGGKTLQVQGSNFNFPISKDRQLAEQARQQGDIATQNRVVPKEAVKANVVAKEKIKQQQERKAQEDFYNKGKTELNQGEADTKTAMERQLLDLNLGFDELEQQGNLAPGLRDFQNMGGLDKGLFLMGSAFEPMGSGKPKIVKDLQTNVSNKTSIVHNPKRSDQLDGIAYDIMHNDSRVGELMGSWDRNKNFVTQSVDINPQFQGKGIGKKAYAELSKSLPAESNVVSSGMFNTDNLGNQPGKNLWESLVKSGQAEKIKEGQYKMLKKDGGKNTKTIRLSTGKIITLK
jgi:hypothetical protein